jgi:hypothetical protein
MKAEWVSHGIVPGHAAVDEGSFADEALPANDARAVWRLDLMLAPTLDGTVRHLLGLFFWKMFRTGFG